MLFLIRNDKLIHRLNPLHKRQPSGIADRTDGEHRLHEQERRSKQCYLQKREVIGDLSEDAQLVEGTAEDHAARRSDRQGGRQRDPYIIQALEGKHGRKLSVAHAHGLEDAEFLLTGQKVCDQRICKVDQREEKHEDQDAVIPFHIVLQADI